jgi:hypothetical protein
LQESLPAHGLDEVLSSELHTPLPLSPGAELVLEEAFTSNRGHTEGRAFLLKGKNILHGREKRIGDD